MNTTTNLGLKKPQKAAGDPIDIDVLNDNSDIIDNFAGETDTALASKQDALTAAQQAAVDSGITAEKLSADESALAEVVDGGAKNHFPTFETKSYGGVTYTYSNGTVNATGTKTGALNYIEVVENRPISELGFSVGDTLKLFNTSDSLLLTVILGDGTTFDPAIIVGNETKELTIGAGKTHIYVRTQILQSVTGAINLSATPMICTAADWAVSQKYVPYCPTMAEMYEMILALQNGTRSAPALAKAEPDEEPETGEAGEEGKEER